MIVELPCGYWRDGSCVRQVALRGLTGEDELWLAEAPREAPRAQLVSELLSRCVAARDALPREFTAGDREALLLHLRRLSFGDAVPATLVCPACTGRMDLDLTASGFLTPTYEAAAAVHETSIHAHRREVRVAFRLPTGADQEAATRLADPAEGARLILERCVTACDLPVAEWSPEAVSHVDALMADLDPQAELKLALRCPECDTPIDTIFDVGSYFLAEVALRRESLLSEVHVLASNYHWSEGDILGLSRARRQAYLQLIASSMEARARA